MNHKTASPPHQIPRLRIFADGRASRSMDSAFTLDTVPYPAAIGLSYLTPGPKTRGFQWLLSPFLLA